MALARALSHHAPTVLPTPLLAAAAPRSAPAAVRTAAAARRVGSSPRPCRRVQQTAYAAAIGGLPPSADPMASVFDSGVYTAGQLMTVHTEQQLEQLLLDHPDQLAVLMCKSRSCRPCKMFLRKYMRLAEKFPEVLVLDIYGDESPETRKLMIGWQVRVTPTFRLYRGPALVDTLTGTNEKKLGRAMLAHLFPDELLAHAAEIEEMVEDEPAAAAAAAAPDAAAAPAGGNGGSSSSGGNGSSGPVASASSPVA